MQLGCVSRTRLTPPKSRKPPRQILPPRLHFREDLDEAAFAVLSIAACLAQPGAFVPHSYSAMKAWKLQYPRKIPIPEPASTSLKKCMPRIIREDAMSKATASRTT
jgi:hypothetical protein